MMSSANFQYPDNLNPFGDEDEEDRTDMRDAKGNSKIDEYPDYLSPFGDEESGVEVNRTDDYDASLNPFGEEEEEKETSAKESMITNKLEVDKDLSPNQSIAAAEGNPFDDEDESDHNDEEEEEDEIKQNIDTATIKQNIVTSSLPPRPPPLPTSQPNSLEAPPVPLPRTKSLLKKEQAQKRRQQQQHQDQSSLAEAPQTISSTISTTSITSLSSLSTTAGINTSASVTDTMGLFQKKKNKRNAPPVPINFKRQVSGSLEAIEEELNDIGDTLATIDEESNLCQVELKATHQIDKDEFAKHRANFEELIRRKNSFVRRQKELMYKKRELKLEQIHSDIEYELRMIGNKQLSNRTVEDEAREKELLKKLVEIVEEKSDIVENLNKDNSNDSYDIIEALRRLNIVEESSPEVQEEITTQEKNVKGSTNHNVIQPSNNKNNENCDKKSIAIGNKFSKIATLLPKSGTLKGTMKLKRKRLFKKCDSQPIDR